MTLSGAVGIIVGGDLSGWRAAPGTVSHLLFNFSWQRTDEKYFRLWDPPVSAAATLLLRVEDNHLIYGH